MNKLAYNDKAVSLLRRLEMMKEGRTDNLVFNINKCINDIRELRKIAFEEQTHNSVEHPEHYSSHPSGVECIDIARYYPFNVGNAFKYLWRAGLKKDASLTDKQKEIEDLEKAIFYINDRIKELKNDNT